MSRLLFKFVLFFFSFELTFHSFSGCLLPLPPSTITKPCHYRSCGHVNQPGQLFTSSQTKEPAFLLSLGWSAVSADGCYLAAYAAINPHLWKGQFNTSNQWDRRRNKKGRHQCGGYCTLRNYKQFFFPKGAKTDRAQRKHITSKREKQINSCASSLFSAQVYARALPWGG